MQPSEHALSRVWCDQCSFARSFARLWMTIQPSLANYPAQEGLADPHRQLQAARLPIGVIHDSQRATWKKGTAARFYRLRRASAGDDWAEVTDLDSVFDDVPSCSSRTYNPLFHDTRANLLPFSCRIAAVFSRKPFPVVAKIQPVHSGQTSRDSSTSLRMTSLG